MAIIKSVLCPIDYSEGSAHALEQAVEKRLDLREVLDGELENLGGRSEMGIGVGDSRRGMERRQRGCQLIDV